MYLKFHYRHMIPNKVLNSKNLHIFFDIAYLRFVDERLDNISYANTINLSLDQLSLTQRLFKKQIQG
ncbi:5413_t:CDS:1, partial [Entrophospora sp. SA101]